MEIMLPVPPAVAVETTPLAGGPTPDPPPNGAALRRARRLALGWTLGVTIALLMPLPALGPDLAPLAGLPVDKLVHTALAAIQAWLLAAALGGGGRRRVALSAALLAAGWLGAIEGLQGLVGRDASVADAIANGVGAVAGALGAWRAGRERAIAAARRSDTLSPA